MSKAQEGQAYAPPPSLLTSFPEASGAFPWDVGSSSPLQESVEGPRDGCQALRPGGRGPGVWGGLPRSSHQLSSRQPSQLSPVAVLTPGLKNAEGCWWGKLIGNRKTWHSFPAGLGLESN